MRFLKFKVAAALRDAAAATTAAVQRADISGATIDTALNEAALCLVAAAGHAKSSLGGLLSQRDNDYAWRLVHRHRKKSDGSAVLLDTAVDAALDRTAAAVELINRAPVSFSVYCNSTYALMFLSQARFSLDSKSAVPLAPRTVVSAGIDAANAASRLRTVLGQLSPLAVTIVRLTSHRQAAMAAGLADLAYRYISTTLTDLEPDNAPSPLLDLDRPGLGFAPVSNNADIKHLVPRLCERIDTVTAAMRDHARHIDKDTATASCSDATVDNIDTAGVWMTASAHRLRTWAESL